VLIRFTDAGAILKQEMEKRIAAASAGATAEEAARLKELLLSPEGMATLVTATVVVLIVLFVLLALLGGLLGAHASRRRARP
jgi:hypothetical protein